MRPVRTGTGRIYHICHRFASLIYFLLIVRCCLKSVAADSGFVYGVDRKGKVYSAGKCPRGFDRGRSDVSQWTDAMAITCGRSCVAALIKNGEVRYAGIFTPRFADILPDFSGRLRRMMED